MSKYENGYDNDPTMHCHLIPWEKWIYLSVEMKNECCSDCPHHLKDDDCHHYRDYVKPYI